MRYARIYPWRRTRRFRAPSNRPEAFFVAQFSAGYTTNMFGFDLRQGQDRYGLTKSRLQKHKSAAMGFVEKVGKQQLSSEAATKYQKRIEKYGYRLFTFLDYDYVPWHNNNAEHAIHAFARYRRFADGRFTKESVSDYLAILSVFQTCEYRGLRVLDVLLSGETNLDRDIRHR